MEVVVIYPQSYLNELKRLFKLEGDYSNSPNDAGGETYLGISKNYNPDWDGWLYVSQRNFDKAKELAIKFYWDNYYSKYNLLQVKDDTLRFAIFELIVNTGKPELIQKAIGVERDGIFGNETITALNSAPNKNLVLILGYFACYYVGLLNYNKKYKTFIYGWLKNRIFDIYKGG